MTQPSITVKATIELRVEEKQLQVCHCDWKKVTVNKGVRVHQKEKKVLVGRCRAQWPGTLQ